MMKSAGRRRSQSLFLEDQLFAWFGTPRGPQNSPYGVEEGTRDSITAEYGGECSISRISRLTRHLTTGTAYREGALDGQG